MTAWGARLTRNIHLFKHSQKNLVIIFPWPRRALWREQGLGLTWELQSTGWSRGHTVSLRPGCRVGDSCVEQIWDQALQAPRAVLSRGVEVTVQNLFCLEPLKGDGLEESLPSASIWQDLIYCLVFCWFLSSSGPEPSLLKVNRF